jgi:UDP-glucuronate decarboxylase
MGGKMLIADEVTTELSSVDQENVKKKVLVTGGAGFVGSHLVDWLMSSDFQVHVVDNLITGSVKNIHQWTNHPRFTFEEADILTVDLKDQTFDEIYHLACPASPPHYQADPVQTMKTCFIGTMNMLEVAKRCRAKILLASTSEVYGDPLVHPQPENYWGHVNPIGPRSCYDEGKRSAESLAYSYEHQFGVAIRIARIFNTYGPRMAKDDGRVVGNFILAGLQGQPMTIYGDGLQTRSFQYVSDLIEGLTKLMASNYKQPVNLGNPQEHSILEFAHIISDLLQIPTLIVAVDAPADDPQRRKPDISLAKRVLDWEPQVSLIEGLNKTVAYFREQMHK